MGENLRLLRFFVVRVASVPSDGLLGMGYRLLRRSRRLYFRIGLLGRLISGSR